MIHRCYESQVLRAVCPSTHVFWSEGGPGVLMPQLFPLYKDTVEGLENWVPQR